MIVLFFLLSFHTVPLLNPDLGNRFPQITANGSGLALLTSAEFEKRLGRSSSFMFGVSNLQWQTSYGSLPNGAVSIYNTNAGGRRDYICKYGCSSGFYSSSKGGRCHYTLSGREYLGYPFEILVNKDNYELLEWKDGSWGSVPQNSVQNCYNGDIYVGKNKYGLGKVHVKHKAFFLPWKGKEYWYKNYQVLTFEKGISSEKIYDVQYKTDGVKIIAQPPEIIRKSFITNNECSPVVKSLALSEMYQVEKRWDTSTAITSGVSGSITAEIPFIGSAGIQLSTETTKQLSRGNTVVVSKTYSVSVEQTVPPNHFCGVSMVGFKYKANIPFTARLGRTYRNGATRWTSITGTYSGVDVGEVRSVVDRCEPVPNAKPCS
ncbi:natterin-3-like [Micropterus salmoides]|uniref:natterin-3-like n=1 Tax=Micropterus salmoides TaxID=27706 RepID=UPI0018EA3D38|nr:natterin-3-like [Micropterus salmoides]XP_038594149.1 natterin-3-like [Micropterus salmoides]